jgi:hypothetical protein
MSYTHKPLLNTNPSSQTQTHASYTALKHAVNLSTLPTRLYTEDVFTISEGV